MQKITGGMTAHPRTSSSFEDDGGFTTFNGACGGDPEFDDGYPITLVWDSEKVAL